VRRAGRVAAAAAALVAVVGCRAARPRYSTDTIATIDGEPVRLSAFRADFEANAGRPIAESSPRVVSALFDQFLREEAWRRLAHLRGDSALGRREAPAALLSRAGSEVLPRAEELIAEYRAHPQIYHRRAQARGRRVFTRTREAAEAARERIVAGEDFARVAQAVSEAPDASQGGRMGSLERGDLPSEFENAIFGLKPGESTGVLAAEDGFVIFRLEEKTPERQLTYEEAEPEIWRHLSQQKANAYLARRVEDLKKQGRIVVLTDRLPFVYSGEFSPRGEGGP
jgi:PPIC-type PPIASE domain